MGVEVVLTCTASISEIRSLCERVTETWTYRHIKRLIDLCLSLVALLLLSPLLLLIAFLIKLSSPGRVLYRWRIVDRAGQPFTTYKFRTMVENAEGMEEALRAAGRNEMKGVYFKIRRDPRVTPIGAILRRFSLDELPTLFSVMTGKLSMVGPQPVRVHEFEKLNEWEKLRLMAKPGLTGFWQISGKNEISDFGDIVRMDIEYIEKWSLTLDLTIMLKTVSYLIAGRNY